MGKPYSIDLRERVVAAVENGGLSRNRAAAQFGLAISTVINWVRRFRETGSVAPGKVGGYRPKTIRGEHRVWLLERIKTDFTLRGLVVELAERGVKVDYRTVWNFVHAEKQRYKKNGYRQRAGSSRRCKKAGTVDEVSKADRSKAPGLHRRDLDQNRHGPAQGLGAARSKAQGKGSTPSLENHDLSGRSAS
jgi:putative transposase